MGLFFAMPANAETIYDNWTTATSSDAVKLSLVHFTDPCSGSAYGDGYTYMGYTTTTGLLIASAQIRVYTYGSSVFGYTPTMEILVGTEIYEGTADTDATGTTKTITFTFAEAANVPPNEEFYIRLQDPTELFDSVPGTTGSYVYWEMVNQSSFNTEGITISKCSANTPYSQPNAGEPRLRLLGTLGVSTGEIGGYSEVPTSTYDGTYSELLPTVGWGNADPPGVSSTIWETRINSYFGTSTAASFPMCLVTNWWILLDDIMGGMTTGTEQFVVVAGGLVPTTTEIGLQAFPEVAAATGLKNITDILIPFVEAMLWLLLGIRIWHAIFGAHVDAETL